MLKQFTMKNFINDSVNSILENGRNIDIIRDNVSGSICYGILLGSAATGLIYTMCWAISDIINNINDRAAEKRKEGL